jgi:hypothetical protein
MPQFEDFHDVVFVGDGVVQMKLNRRQQDAPQIGNTRMRHHTSPARGNEARAKNPRSSSDEKRFGAAGRFSYHQSDACSICRAARGEIRRAYVNDRVTEAGEASLRY